MCWRCTSLFVYISGGIISSLFHVPYWTYKWSREDAHKGNLYRYADTAGGKIVYMSIAGAFGSLIGVIASGIWPISTPLTIVNIRERLGENDGFFFHAYKPKGWNRSLRNVFCNLNRISSDDNF